MKQITQFFLEGKSPTLNKRDNRNVKKRRGRTSKSKHTSHAGQFHLDK